MEYQSSAEYVGDGDYDKTVLCTDTEYLPLTMDRASSTCPPGPVPFAVTVNEYYELVQIEVFFK